MALDWSSGIAKFVYIATMPIAQNPNYHTATVHRHADGQSSSYFAQLFGAIEYTWVEIDVASGKTVSSSTLPVDQLPELSFCTYISA